MAKTSRKKKKAKSKEDDWEIGSLSGIIKAKSQKEACVKALKTYLKSLPYADGSYVQVIRTRLKTG